jgi:hypothetical protein
MCHCVVASQNISVSFSKDLKEVSMDIWMFPVMHYQQENVHSINNDHICGPFNFYQWHVVLQLKALAGVVFFLAFWPR